MRNEGSGGRRICCWSQVEEKEMEEFLFIAQTNASVIVQRVCNALRT